MANPLIIIAGPTAVGKSDMAVMLAKRINGEIISADSMQVYKGMDIGSAKITQEEMQGIKHYLIDILDPVNDFNVVSFQKYAKEAYEEIVAKGKIPIVCGGTGFYIQSLLYDIDFSQSEGELSEYRMQLEALAKEKGPDFLYEELVKVDPESALAIHKNNVKRVIRALEYFHDTGTKISTHNMTEKAKESPYTFGYFVLNDYRDKVYERINLRVDKMVSAGLVDEVKKLKDLGLTKNHVSMQGLGYKEILMYLDGEISLDEALYIIKRDSRHFAKRQLTWFNRESDLIWLNKYEYNYDNELILEAIIKSCKDRNILE